MTQFAIELLTQERAIELWPQIVPLVEQSVAGNPMTASDMDAQYVFNAVCADEAVIFAGYMGMELATILALQFSDANGHKCADIIAMAGRRLFSFKKHYWKPIIEWLRANEVEFLDSYVPTERAMLYTTKFGFDTSCAHIRMSLGNHNG